MKNKGSRTERELVHMFFNNNWSAIRVAGSGSTSLPACDLLAGSQGRVLAIECKSTKKDHKYVTKEQMLELKNFAQKFGAEAWIAIRFNILGWFFLKPDQLREIKNSYAVSKEHAIKQGLKFNDLIKK